MASFSKADCCLCGQKAGLLTRQKIADHHYICSHCRLLCSRDISGSRWHTMSMEEVRAHMEELENDQKLLKDKFRETDSIAKRGLAGDALLCIDGRRGWWYLPSRHRPDVFSFEHVLDYRLELDTYIPGGEACKRQREEPEASQSPALQRNKDKGSLLLDLLDDLLGVSLRASRLPRCPKGEKITGMHLVVTLKHPYIDEVKIDVLNCSSPNHRDIRIAYEAAADIIDLFDYYGKSFNFAYDLTDAEDLTQEDPTIEAPKEEKA